MVITGEELSRYLKISPKLVVAVRRVSMLIMVLSGFFRHDILLIKFQKK